MSFPDDERWSGTGGWWLSGGVISVMEPATGRQITSLGRADVSDLERSVTQASEAQAAWAARPFTERAAILRRAADLWTHHSAAVQYWLIHEAGSIRLKAEFEVHGAVDECLEAAALPSHALGEVMPSESAQLSMTVRTPVGVVGVISPFNLPLLLAIRSVAPALALGNAVILKPDPRTSYSGGVILARIFEEAGLPDGLLHVLPGGGDLGSAMVTHPGIRAISFTGSTQAGRAVGELAARHFTRTHLELGGNNALIVLADADLDQAMSAVAFGSFFNQGQGCVIIGRHLVHESIYDAYVHKLADRASALVVGNPESDEVALGPIIDAKQRDRIHSLVMDSVAAGAELLTGGTYDGLFYRPTVLAEAGPGIPAYDNEVFGPVACVTRFSTLDEAVELASNTQYGLALGIITADVATGLSLAKRIPTGMAHVNDQTLKDDAHVPFGGMGESGNSARFGSAAANIEAYTDTRWITVHTQVPSYPF
ncbi:aldehyde dehydrogenase [Planotetraspora thailandica]|uniref:Aldehyde dehydrogenase n=2 Tax=Planotetraspora thailandica TaxID=487172 RepID=A0A8J3V833_9ACTN|nr:aldehyde dehydrogenase [Planotetraspora thailandica]